MAAVVVCGAGTCGSITAMLLAGDGHDVVVLERDPMEPPPPAAAWEAWERRGVTQFRLPHFLLPRWRHEMASALPQVLQAFEAAGAHSFNLFGPFRDVVASPERFDVVTGRRPVLDAVLAAAAAETPGVEVRRGVAIAGLELGPPVVPGTPHVVGVRTEAGDVVAADLVVAATGRRSPLARWLADAGARPAHEEEEDSGFVYYGRYVRSSDGSSLVDRPGLVDFGSVGLLALPADDGTCGIGIIGMSDDAALRPLRREEPWRRVLAALPGGQRLLDSEPISPLVAMAGIEDCYRRLVVDGAPVATGVVAVADAWAATNPTLGRGITLGTMHSLALRLLVRDHLDDPLALAVAFDDVTERDFTPWYRSTVWQDRNKLHSYAAAVAGDVPYRGDDRWDELVRLMSLFGSDLDASVLYVDSSTFLSRTPEELLADPKVQAKLPAERPAGHAGPTRPQLLELIAG
jgi:2-polyprenyl-6-methoxyphenol hydroxylase-like FAD-dependent oxidoreductase